ncbi:MAG: Flagellar hook-basal body complex protein FliE (precursor) [Candidatus Tokpelaia hoelldobleri]|uniref:Flagellar hook-basal body complex protein FliE n=1 Tax=Candidatus Tokpelaia hoelldobleri TaxID=1902579 RepID=A0A1U9JSW3_9HYPH|nr:MAG: Flagellar hook-basal body complex protein FliE (precursor) [Candidatus Tokpelaia hoelldoblerii]
MIEPLVSVATRAALEKLADTYGYANVAQTPSVQMDGMPAVEEGAQAPSFSQVLSGLTNGMAGKIGHAEELSMRRMAGEEVPIREVVSAVMDAEQSLSAAIAIRDKIVQAYLEISRMQI